MNIFQKKHNNNHHMKHDRTNSTGNCSSSRLKHKNVSSKYTIGKILFSSCIDNDKVLSNRVLPPSKVKDNTPDNATISNLDHMLLTSDVNNVEFFDLHSFSSFPLGNDQDNVPDPELKHITPQIHIH